MRLFLDDDPYRAAVSYQRMSPQEQSTTIWCKTVQEAIQTLWDYKDKLIQVSFNHDLGSETYVLSSSEFSGMEIVRWLEKLSKTKPRDFDQFKKTKFIVHTWNILAGNKMEARLIKLGLNAEYVPFGLRK